MLPTHHLILLLSSTLLPTPTLSAPFNNATVCVGPYILCSTALCTPIPHNATHALCSCAGPYHGLNMSPNVSCLARTQQYLSTFSLVNSYGPLEPPNVPIHDAEEAYKKPPLYSFPCGGVNAAPWAQCNGAPCEISPGRITCTCPIVPKSDNLYYGPECPATEEGQRELCLRLRSSTVLPEGADARTLPGIMVRESLGAFYGVVPEVRSCVVGRGEGTG